MYYAQHESTHMCVEMGGNTHADDRMKQRDYSLRREENRRTRPKRNKRDNENRIASWLDARSGGKTGAAKTLMWLVVIIVLRRSNPLKEVEQTNR